MGRFCRYVICSFLISHISIAAVSQLEFRSFLKWTNSRTYPWMTYYTPFFFFCTTYSEDHLKLCPCYSRPPHWLLQGIRCFLLQWVWGESAHTLERLLYLLFHSWPCSFLSNCAYTWVTWAWTPKWKSCEKDSQDIWLRLEVSIKLGNPWDTTKKLRKLEVFIFVRGWASGKTLQL